MCKGWSARFLLLDLATSLTDSIDPRDGGGGGGGGMKREGRMEGRESGKEREC